MSYELRVPSFGLLNDSNYRAGGIYNISYPFTLVDLSSLQQSSILDIDIILIIYTPVIHT